MDKKIETVVETVYEQQCKEVTVPECDIITVVVTEAGKCYVIVCIVSYREITNKMFSLTQSKPYIF